MMDGSEIVSLILKVEGALLTVQCQMDVTKPSKDVFVRFYTCGKRQGEGKKGSYKCTDESVCCCVLASVCLSV